MRGKLKCFNLVSIELLKEEDRISSSSKKHLKRLIKTGLKFKSTCENIKFESLFV